MADRHKVSATSHCYTAQHWLHPTPLRGAGELVVRALVEQAGRFEQLMVRPGSMALLVFGQFTAWAQGRPILGFLQGGTTNWLLVSIVLCVSMVPIIPRIFLPRGKVFEAA